MKTGTTVSVEFTCIESGDKTGEVILECSDKRFEGKPRLVYREAKNESKPEK